MKFDPKAKINSIRTLVQIMAGRWLGDKPSSKPMMVIFTDASLVPNALNLITDFNYDNVNYQMEPQFIYSSSRDKKARSCERRKT